MDKSMRINSNGNVNIDGRVFSGDITISKNGVVIANGIDRGTLHGPITITVDGNVTDLELSAGTVTVNGTVNKVSTMSGDVKCQDIEGNVNTMSGDINAKNISGNVSTLSGDIYK